jgi:hypothetical protein
LLGILQACWKIEAPRTMPARHQAGPITEQTHEEQT